LGAIKRGNHLPCQRKKTGLRGLKDFDKIPKLTPKKNFNQRGLQQKNRSGKSFVVKEKKSEKGGGEKKTGVAGTSPLRKMKGIKGKGRLM